MMTCDRKVVIFAIGARKSAYALLFLTASLLTACSGGGQESGGAATTISIPTAGPGDVEKFFQLTPGNRWGFNFTVNETGRPSISGFETIAVTGTKTISGYSTVVLSYSGQGNAEEYYLKNNAGLFFFGDNSADPVIAAISPYQVFRFPLQPIDTFVQVDKTGIDFGADLDGDGRNETIAIYSTVTVVGFETVAVPAGTFNDCARIETDIAETLTLSRSGTTVKATGVSTEWYAAGIGPVKKHSEYSGSGYTQSFDYALASYTVDGRKSDTTPPAIASVQPSPGGVLVTAQIQAVFSEEIDPLTLNATSFAVRNAANQQVAGTISYANKTAAFTPPAPLAAGIYSATMTTGIQDVAGNPLQADYSWNFTVDRTAPAVVSTSPASNATNVPPSASVSVTFSEEIDPASLNVYSFTVTGGGYSVPGNVTYSNKTATFVPSTALSKNTLYTVTLTTAVRDLAGNHLADNYSWSFTTDPGLFENYVAFPTGSWPEAVAIGDVNGDGRNDVVMTTSFYFDAANDYKVFVFLQNADGTLAPPVKYATSSTYTCRAATVAIGDVNHDGRNDVVIGDSGCGIEVFLQNGGGTLAPGVFHPSIDSHKIRIADLNNDGLLDVAGIGWGTNTVSVWLQNASGAFDNPVTYSVTHGGYDDLELGDVNKDGLTDIIVMSGQLYADSNLGILTQKAGGGFNAPAYYGVGANVLTAGVAVGDVNGDNANDVVVTYGGNSPSARIGVFSQNGSGTLEPPASYNSYDIPEAVEIADVTGDGRKDIIVLHGGWMAMGVYEQLPDGTLQKEELYGIPYASHYNPHGLAVADINGDGQNDVVIADYNYGLVVLYHNKPAGVTAVPAKAAALKSARERLSSPPYSGTRLRR